MKKVPVELNGKTILVTGSPGFIGTYLVIRLIEPVPHIEALAVDR